MPSSIQSALDSAGVQAARIEGLWWLMFWVCTAVFVLVMLAVAVAVIRGAAGRSIGTPDSTLTRNVTISITVSTIALIGLLLASVLTGRALASLNAPGALGIQITGYQW